MVQLKCWINKKVHQQFSLKYVGVDTTVYLAHSTLTMRIKNLFNNIHKTAGCCQQTWE